MHPRRLTRLLLSPSLTSGMVVLCLAIVIIGYDTWTYISRNQLFYDYLFSAYGLKTYVWQQSLAATTLKNSFLGNAAAYYVFVAVAAAVGGLITYTALEAVSLLVHGGRFMRRELEMLGTSRRQILHALLTRLGLRIVSLAGWALYTAFCFSMLLPFVIILNQMGIDHLQAGQTLGWLDSGAALILLLLALHIQVIFARLACLRPRLFWGGQAIEEAEATT